MAVWIGDSPASSSSSTIVDTTVVNPGDALDTGIIDMSDYTSALIVLLAPIAGKSVWEIDMVDNSGTSIPVISGYTPGMASINGWGDGASGTPAQAIPGPLPTKIRITCPGIPTETPRVLIQAR